MKCFLVIILILTFTSINAQCKLKFTNHSDSVIRIKFLSLNIDTVLDKHETSPYFDVDSFRTKEKYTLSWNNEDVKSEVVSKKYVTKGFWEIIFHFSNNRYTWMTQLNQNEY